MKPIDLVLPHIKVYWRIIALGMSALIVVDVMQLFIPRVIKQVVDAGHKYGIEVGKCGEMAGDPFYTMVLMGLGFDSLSMNPISIPLIKEIVRLVSYQDARKVAKKALRFSTTLEVEHYVKKVMMNLPI